MQNRQKIRVNLKLIEKQAREILKDLERDDAELSLLLTDDNGIQELNKRYLKKDKPTDVLSFPMEDPYVIGDIVISVETAKAQAKENNATLDKEMARLLIHGILHLLGFEHEKGGRQAQKMREEEDRLLKIAKCKLQNVK